MLSSLDSLRCFLAAARLLNFRAAARTVALTPTALGQRIQKLEEELGASLFHRSTRNVSLTEAGLALLPVAQRCLDAADECGRAARGELGTPPMEITLGTRQELGMSWILPQLDRLAAALPSLDVHLYFGSGSDLLLRVRTMDIDCAVTSSRFADPKLDAVRLLREDYVFVGAPALLEKNPLDRDEHAAAHTLLDENRDLPLFRYFREAPGGGDRLHFGRIVRLGSIETIRTRALQGAGVAVVPAYLVERDLATSALRRLFPEVTPLHDWFRLVFRADDPKRPVYEKLAARLREEALA
jgi:LysR family glycine cleavage system transcriptional activator